MEHHRLRGAQWGQAEVLGDKLALSHHHVLPTLALLPPSKPQGLGMLGVVRATELRVHQTPAMPVGLPGLFLVRWQLALDTRLRWT